MGNSHSSLPVPTQQAVNNEEPVLSSGVFGFVSLLFGSVKFPLSVISCADALMDLAAEAEALVALARETEEQSSTNATISFEPYVKTKRAAELERIPSMHPLEKLVFVSDTIRIVACNGTSSEFKLLTATELNELVVLYARLVELNAIRQHERRTDNPHDSLTDLDECGICLNDNDEIPTCVLPCGHQLCQTCEKLWVRRKLDCPFCRRQFKSAKDVTKNGWELTANPQMQIQQDVEYFRSKIASYWTKSLSITDKDKVLQQLQLEKISRRLDPFGEERDGFVFL